MDDLRKLAYCLAACGGAVSEQGFHLLYEKNNKLVEELWNGTKVQKDGEVGENIKTGAPAAYVLMASDEEGVPEQRLIFSVDSNDILRCFAYSTDIEEWAEESMPKAGNVKLHHSSALAADVGPEGITLFFQNEHGKLQTLVLGDEDWELGEVLPASPREGTALATLVTETSFLLFYIASDNVMHYLERKYETNSWEDHSWPSANIPSSFSRFKVSRDPESGIFEAHVIVDDKLIRFTGAEKKVELGTFKGKDFVPTNSAQASRRIFSGVVIKNGRLAGWEEKRRDTYRHRDGHTKTRTIRRFYPV